ncbi:MAG: hypothetical protein K2X69_07920 [Silvanigrellaceae bacterium]|nr:hypothetical protein [Silvanigrellaceae bacterium]
MLKKFLKNSLLSIFGLNVFFASSHVFAQNNENSQFNSILQIYEPYDEEKILNLEEKLKNANGKIIKEFSTKNIVELYNDNNFKYIQKLYDNSLEIPEEEMIYENPNKYSSNEELFSYKLSRKLKLNILPPTAIFQKEGSIDYIVRQVYIDQSISAKKRQIDGLDKLNSPIIIFDYLIGLKDRYNNNFLISEDGSITAFDNESIFATNRKHALDIAITERKIIKIEKELYIISEKLNEIQNKLIGLNKKPLDKKTSIFERDKKNLEKQKKSLISKKSSLDAELLTFSNKKTSLLNSIFNRKSFENEELKSFFFKEEIWNEFNNESNWKQWFYDNAPNTAHPKNDFGTKQLEKDSVIFLKKLDFLKKIMTKTLKKEGKDNFFKSAQELREQSMKERKEFYIRHMNENRKFSFPASEC